MAAVAQFDSAIAEAEAAAQQAAKKVQHLKNEASRDAAVKLFLEHKFTTYTDIDKAAAHHIDCRSVTKWLGRTERTPKESLKYFPLPKHADNAQYCPGCACDVWADCLRKTGFTAH